MDIKNFHSAISQIAEEKGISADKVMETIEMAIAAAYKKDYGKKGQMIKAKLDSKTGSVKFWQIKQVVEEKMLYTEEELEQMKDSKEEIKEEDKKIRFSPEKHIMLDEAKKLNSKIKVGEDLETILETKEDYGRIAAQTAKQVILQRIREAEKESVFSEYKSKEGELISGVVQRIEGRNILLDLGKTLGILPREEQVPGEFYRPGQRIKVFVLKVEDSSRGSVVFLSRIYPKIISKLFELEVPEIASEQVQIRSIAREAGSRSKIAVESNQEGIDPIGAMVGQKGTRVMAVINELGGEKIDIIEYDDEPDKYIANALSPAKVLEVKVLPKNKAQVTVPDDQLSLAIGKNGQNVRLAAKLTGWKIDIKSPDGEIVSSEDGTKQDKEVEEVEEIKKEKKETKKEVKKEKVKKTKNKKE
ncbi:MAG: transcription termination factor NusA [bacterium]